MRHRTLLHLSFVLLILCCLAVSSQAQATRTWVSGVGDDANPCSRTAPCKTFAGAISKTAAGGEISVLDPGGYGAVTITKSITIDGAGTNASILASSTTGIVISAAAGDTVILRNLNINGGAPGAAGIRGVRILSARAVHIENCTIFGFTGSPGRGVDINLVSGAQANVFITNTSIKHNAAAAIAVLPQSGQPVVRLTISQSSLNDNASALFAGEGARVVLTQTVMSGNSVTAVDASGSAVPSLVEIDDSIISLNSRGIQTSGAAAVRLGRSTIVGNNMLGFQISGGTIASYGDNYFDSNGANVGVLTSISGQRQ